MSDATETLIMEEGEIDEGEIDKGALQPQMSTPTAALSAKGEIEVGALQEVIGGEVEDNTDNHGCNSAWAYTARSPAPDLPEASGTWNVWYTLRYMHVGGEPTTGGCKKRMSHRTWSTRYEWRYPTLISAAKARLIKGHAVSPLGTASTRFPQAVRRGRTAVHAAIAEGLINVRIYTGEEMYQKFFCGFVSEIALADLLRASGLAQQFLTFDKSIFGLNEPDSLLVLLGLMLLDHPDLAEQVIEKLVSQLYVPTLVGKVMEGVENHYRRWPDEGLPVLDMSVSTAHSQPVWKLQAIEGWAYTSKVLLIPFGNGNAGWEGASKRGGEDTKRKREADSEGTFSGGARGRKGKRGRRGGRS